MPGFLEDVRVGLKAGTFRPLPVRQRMIPEPGGSGKVRKLGIPTITDRIDHAAPMGRVRSRVNDKRVLGLVKAFLKVGVLTETGTAEVLSRVDRQSSLCRDL